MKFLAPCLTVVAIVAAALVLAIYRADNPPEQVPTAPSRIVHIADWHYFPVADCNDTGDSALIERIQQQQMDAIRALDVREVWMEGQSDETIAEFRRHVLRLRDVKPPDADSDNPVDQLIADMYREDLLLIGAAGPLLMAGEIDDVLPLEDHEAWQAAQPVDCAIPEASDAERERAMARRLPRRAVIVLGVSHDLGKWLPKEAGYRVVRVEAIPD